MSQDALYHATILTFEQLGFLFATEGVVEEVKDMPLDTEVRVDFTGPFNGAIVLRVPRAMLAPLASNMLGEMEELPHALQLDALKETANVICGNLLPLLGGADKEFRLAPPALQNQPMQVAAAITGSLTAKVEVGLDEGWAEVLLYVAE